MKHKLIFVGTALAVLLCCVVLTTAGQGGLEPRVHQHLEAPGPKLARAEAEQDGTFHTHLPIILLDTNGQPIPGEARDGSTVTASLVVIDGEAGDNALSDAPTLECTSQVRYRGNSSMSFEKKSLRLKLVDQSSADLSLEMLGMDAEDEWVLNGPYLDKTLLRNYMLMNLSGQVMAGTPEVRYCELFFNGEYQGVYVMMENISRNLIGLDKPRQNQDRTSYLVRLDRGGIPQLDQFSHYTMQSRSVMDVVYPAGEACTPARADYIQKDISRIEKALYSLDFDDPALGYRALLDVDSFVDYMVLNEFFQNYDATRYSTYIYRPLGGKLSIGPVWDFNNALDNYIETPLDGTGFLFPHSLWYTMLCKDTAFVERVIFRYRQLRQTILSEEYLMDYIDGTAAWLGPAIERNFQVWGTEPQLLLPVQRNLDSNEEALEQMKSFLTTRGAWLDENIELLYQYCHFSATKAYQH